MKHFILILMSLILLTLSTCLMWTNNLHPGKSEVVLEATSKPVLSKRPPHLDSSKANLNKAPFKRLEDSLYYCDLTYYNAMGFTSLEHEAAIRLTSTELGFFTDWNIIAISWYHYDGGSPNGVVKVYDEGTPTHPGPEITSEPYSGAGIGWVRCNLSSPVPIDGSSDLWCSVEVTYGPYYYPLGVDSGPAVDYKGDFLYYESAWYELQDLGFDNNWMLICIVDSLGPVVEETKIPVRESIYDVRVFPNPFTDNLEIDLGMYDVGRRMHETPLRIYDVSGRLVKRFTIDDLRLTNITWDGKDEKGKKVKSGIYFIKLKVKSEKLNVEDVKKVIKIE